MLLQPALPVIKIYINLEMQLYIELVILSSNYFICIFLSTICKMCIWEMDLMSGSHPGCNLFSNFIILCFSSSIRLMLLRNNYIRNHRNF